MFSRRTRWPADPGPFAGTLARAAALGDDLVDLTVANPSRVDLVHETGVYEALGGPHLAAYEPIALGLPSAREAVAAYYAERRRAPIAADRLALCASTSEAYAHLLALLCDPGDAVLVPTPSYPLLRYLADLALVELVPYRLAYDGEWHVDLADLRAQLVAHPRARAIVAVAPNNPTGNYLEAGELAAIDALAAHAELAVLVDEVFHDYPLADDRQGPSPLEGEPAALTFVLSGLSKVAALPQVKLAWIACAGPSPLVAAALARLEVIADTFLSATTAVQRAAPAIFAATPAIQRRILARTRRNLAALREACRGSALTPLDVAGGWTALCRLPAIDDLDDLAWAERLVDRARVLAQPGYLYDLDAPHLALSLLAPADRFAEGAARLVRGVAEALEDPPACAW